MKLPSALIELRSFFTDCIHEFYINQSRSKNMLPAIHQPKTMPDGSEVIRFTVRSAVTGELRNYKIVISEELE